MVLFLMLVIGFGVRRLRIVSVSFVKELANFLFAVIIPARIITVMQYSFSFDTLIQMGWLLVVSIVINQTLEMVGNTTSPLSMILAGLILANAKFKEMFYNVRVYLVSVVRLVVLPIIVLMALRWTSLSQLSVGVVVLLTAMPVAASASILAQKYDGNTYLGAQCVFVSTLLSIITIPLVVFLLP